MPVSILCSNPGYSQASSALAAVYLIQGIRLLKFF